MSPLHPPSKWITDATTDWVDEQLLRFFSEYEHTGAPYRVSFRNLCSNWPWAKRSDVYTHYMHRYPAKLLPYIPIFFLSSSLARDDTILDPFAGTGTVAVEAIVHFTHPRDCKLVEINPLARLISAAKTTPLDPEILEKKAVELFVIIDKLKVSDVKIPQFPGIDFWFRKDAQINLAVIRSSIEFLEASFQEKDFFWACYSSIIRDMSRADPKVSPPVLMTSDKFVGDYKGKIQKKIEQKNHYDAYPVYKEVIYKNINRIRMLWDTWQNCGKRAIVVGHDARVLTESPYLGKGTLDITKENQLPDNSIGMVITSPPYINAQKYTRTTKFELWWLGLLEETTEALINYDKKLVGTERIAIKEYSELRTIGNKSADSCIEKIYDTDRLKAGIVSKYFTDMKASLKEIKRVLKPNGYCVLVIGNNFVSKQSIPNNQILSELAMAEGLIPKAMLVDEIRSRGLITKRHETAGMIADEWVLLMQKTNS
jgi:DNA modification methylase